jgi:hypothetical protein
MLTDRFDDARANTEKRLPFSLDMVADAAHTATNSNDLTTVMIGTAISIASLMLLRISEYATSSTHTDTSRASDHRILASNVLFYAKDGGAPMSPTHLYMSQSEPALRPHIDSVSITLASSKADTSADGITFSFNSADFDMSDLSNPINLLKRWAYMVNHAPNDPLFSFRNYDGSITLLHSESITMELRRIAALHHIPNYQLSRFTPHSIRIGMASHLANLGITSTVILQMGRWSPKSSAAPKYQRLSVGSCSQVARATADSSRSTGHTSIHTLQTLIRPESYNRIYKQKSTANAASPVLQPRHGHSTSLPNKPLPLRRQYTYPPLLSGLRLRSHKRPDGRQSGVRR